MPDHTPGPWIFDEDSGLILGPNGDKICDPSLPANMRLILAAPDLLAACQIAHDWVGLFSERSSHAQDVFYKLDAAIAKSHGKSV